MFPAPRAGPLPGNHGSPPVHRPAGRRPPENRRFRQPPRTTGRGPALRSPPPRMPLTARGRIRRPGPRPSASPRPSRAPCGGRLATTSSHRWIDQSTGRPCRKPKPSLAKSSSSAGAGRSARRPRPCRPARAAPRRDRGHPAFQGTGTPAGNCPGPHISVWVVSDEGCGSRRMKSSPDSPGRVTGWWCWTRRRMPTRAHCGPPVPPGW